MDVLISWISLLGSLLILVGAALCILSIGFAVFAVRKLEAGSGLENWGVINVLGLIVGFSIPVGTAIALEGAKLIGHHRDDLLIPVILVFIPLLALAVISSFTRLIYSGLSRSQLSKGPHETSHSSSDRHEPK